MLSRRDFLKALGLFATFPLIGGLLKRHEPLRTEVVPTPPPPPPREFTDTPQDMLGGEVIKIEGDHLELRTAQGVQRVILASDVVIDEGAWTSGFPILPGDQLFMVGHPTPKSWVAEKVWVNAVNVTGEIQKCSLEGEEVICEIKTARPLQNKNVIEGWLPRKFLVDRRFDPSLGISLRVWRGRIFKLQEGAFVRVVGRMYKGRLCIINIFDEP